jgi:PRTRC genetic system protein E
MFAQLASIAKSTMIQIIITAEGDDQLRVNVLPKAVEGQNAAMSTPLSMVATPAELDEGFVDILTKWRDKRVSLSEQFENTQLVMEAAQKESLEKVKTSKLAKPKGSPATSSPTSFTSGNDDDDDGLAEDKPFEDEQVSTPVTVATRVTSFSAKKPNDTAELDLFS